ncbi:MAG TPA: GNAT family N-acetyltransferase [Patescibacteria group bacterium]|nr:GNAT family N-acetyltransferase [Patescibacteria group bacterium]
MSTDVSIVVRFATPNDIESCFVFDHSDRQDIIENKTDMHEIILAERCGEVIGYLKLEYIWSKLPYISLIILKPEFRGKGIGSLMLNYLIEFLQLNGFDTLLSSSQVNEAEPQMWHRKKGFIECGILNGINEHGIGEVFFRLDLVR